MVFVVLCDIGGGHFQTATELFPLSVNELSRAHATMLQPNRLGLQKNVACSQSLKVWDSAVGQQRGEGLHNSRLTGVFGLFALGLVA